MENQAVPDLMTVHEVAELLRLKERKIYDLLAHKQIPCTRVAGKWLFPRRQIETWLAQNSEFQIETGSRAPDLPAVLVGSHDPLLEWALGEIGLPLALQVTGSSEGLERFAADEAVLCGIHLLDLKSAQYNVPMVDARLRGEPVVLIEWAQRHQGLVMAPENPLKIERIEDLETSGARIIERQEGSGSRLLFDRLLKQAGMKRENLKLLPRPARSHHDVAFSIYGGHADAGLAVFAVAQQMRLSFLPLHTERYDLLVRRRDYFEPPFQSLLAFARTRLFQDKAAEMGGYDLAGLGRVRYNAPG